MSDIKDQLGSINKKIAKVGTFVGKYSVTVFFVIASLAILAALLQSRAYLNPERDEQKYSEGISGIQYKTISDESIEKLRNQQADRVIDVAPSLVPDRNNPFAE